MNPEVRLDDAMFANGPTDPDRWVFHYTSLDNAKLIAESGVLWFKSMATKNDPREFKAPEPVTMRVHGAGPQASPEQVREAIDRITRWRLDVLAGSFTMDSDHGAPASGTRANARGYARPALWAHYADKHRGVCFVFERQAIIDTLADIYGTSYVAQDIEYPPDPFKSLGMYLDVNVVDAHGIEWAVAHHVTRHRTELLFRKNADWENEREWRCCVIDQPTTDHIELPLHPDTVAGLIAGIATEDLSDIQPLAARFGIEATTAQAYQHQANIIDVLPIRQSSSGWKPLTPAEVIEYFGSLRDTGSGSGVCS